MTTPALGAAAAEYGVGKARQAGREARMVRIPTGDRQYQGVILAEFLIAVLIVAVAPLARGKQASDTSVAPWGGSDAGSGSYGPSPYGVDDFKQLLGVGAVYFVLALLSSGKYGKFSAWFGGLILVAIGLAETTSGGLAAIFGIFQPGSKSAGSATLAPNYGAGLGQFEPVPTDPFAQPVQNATGIFPTIGPASNVVTPTPSGAPSFTQQVTQGGTTTTLYQGGPGVVTTNTGTQLA